MSTILFVALANADPDGGYRATFPDLPECVVKARDMAELLLAARQALAATPAAASADAGEAWPKPTPIESDVADARRDPAAGRRGGGRHRRSG